METSVREYGRIYVMMPCRVWSHSGNDVKKSYRNHYFNCERCQEIQVGLPDEYKGD